MILLNIKETQLKPPRNNRNEPGNARVTLLIRLFVFTGIAILIGCVPLWASPADRQPSSMKFPNYRNTRDTNDINRYYPAYLKFVLAIGKRTNRRLAKRLNQRYEALRKYSPRAAAKFLHGLRYEMVHKIHLENIDKSRLTTRNRKYRRWVNKHLAAWYHEADEHLFRAIVYRKTGNSKLY